MLKEFVPIIHYHLELKISTHCESVNDLKYFSIHDLEFPKKKVSIVSKPFGFEKNFCLSLPLHTFFYRGLKKYRLTTLNYISIHDLDFPKKVRMSQSYFVFKKIFASLYLLIFPRLPLRHISIHDLDFPKKFACPKTILF